MLHTRCLYKNIYKNIGLITIMFNSENKMLPEIFCSRCGSIMAPKLSPFDIPSEAQEYVCLKCGESLCREQIDALRKHSGLKEWYM